MTHPTPVEAALAALLEAERLAAVADAALRAATETLTAARAEHASAVERLTPLRGALLETIAHAAAAPE